MTPPTMVFGREKKFRLGGTSFPTHEDFFLGPGSRTKYTYDAWNRLVQVSNSSTTVNYEYDGRTAWSSASRAGPRTITSTPARRWSRPARRPAGKAPRRRRSSTSTSGRPRATPRSSATRSARSTGQPIPADRIYYLTDANDNVTAITNNAGQVLERYVYSPFGQVTYYDCSGGSWVQVTTSPNHNTILFAGQSLDPATGLYYDHARWYSPGSGAARSSRATRWATPRATRTSTVTAATTPSARPTRPAWWPSPPRTWETWLDPGAAPATGYDITWHSFTIFVPNGAVVQSSEGYNGANINVTWQNFCAGTTWSVVHIVGSTGPEGDSVWTTGRRSGGARTRPWLGREGRGCSLRSVIKISLLPAAVLTIPSFTHLSC